MKKGQKTSPQRQRKVSSLPIIPFVEMCLCSGQVCPGKSTIYLYVEGDKNVDKIKAKLPPSDVAFFHEIVLKPGEQYTIKPETWHWFQAGPDGAVISEFSTRSTDETDVFTDKTLVRQTEIED